MIDTAKFKDIFILEVEDHIEQLNLNLVELEKKPLDTKLLNNLMRSAHTLKGSSAAMGYVKLAFLMHVIEDVFDYARSNLLNISPEIIQTLFTTIDRVEKSVTEIKEKGQESDTDSLAQELVKLTGVKTEGAGKSKRDESGKPVSDKTPETTAPVLEEETQEIEQKPVKQDEVEAEIKQITHIKVPVARLDSLMDLVEELLIDKMRLEQLVASSDVGPELELLTKHLSRVISEVQFYVMQVRLVPVEQVLARFPRMIRDLAQQSQKEVELVIEGAETELDRTIVDKLAQPLVHLLRNAVDHGIDKQGKITIRSAREKNIVKISVEDDGLGINWQKVGESARKKGIIKEVSQDKVELEKLIFHPQLSTKEKVTETSGRGVGLSVVKDFAESMGGRVVVTSPVTDRGTSFSLELPQSVAVINALLVKAEGEVLAIPFAQVVRSVSVKLDHIKTVANQETVIIGETDIPLVRLKLVLDYHQLPMIETEIKEQQAIITESTRLRSNELQRSNTRLRPDELRRSETRLRSNELQRSEAKPVVKSKDQLVVIVSMGDEQLALAVDELISQQEVVVKPLSSIIKNTKGVSGFTILGDGRAVLILETSGLLKDNSNYQVAE